MTRQERIEKMFDELQYEITVGMTQGELDEMLTYSFIVPVSHNQPNGVVLCEFRTRPVHNQVVYGSGFVEPRLKIVKSEEME
jgi:hypothetical protein